MFEIIFGMIKDFPHEISLGRMFESIVLLGLIWSKLKPHLTKIEDRLAGLEGAVRLGFDAGEVRFEKIEKDVKMLEVKIATLKGGEHAKSL